MQGSETLVSLQQNYVQSSCAASKIKANLVESPRGHWISAKTAVLRRKPQASICHGLCCLLEISEISFNEAQTRRGLNSANTFNYLNIKAQESRARPQCKVSTSEETRGPQKQMHWVTVRVGGCPLGPMHPGDQRSQSVSDVVASSSSHLKMSFALAPIGLSISTFILPSLHLHLSLEALIAIPLSCLCHKWGICLPSLSISPFQLPLQS